MTDKLDEFLEKLSRQASDIVNRYVARCARTGEYDMSRIEFCGQVEGGSKVIELFPLPAQRDQITTTPPKPEKPPKITCPKGWWLGPKSGRCIPDGMSEDDFSRKVLQPLKDPSWPRGASPAPKKVIGYTVINVPRKPWRDR